MTVCNAVPHTSEKVFANQGPLDPVRDTSSNDTSSTTTLCRITSSSKSNFVECIFVEYDT